MKKNTIILLAALSFVSYSVYGQDENLLWPLKGKDAGENILYRPQEPESPWQLSGNCGEKAETLRGIL